MEELASQIGRHLSGNLNYAGTEAAVIELFEEFQITHKDGSPDRPTELSESFDLWYLDENKVKDVSTSQRDWAYRSKYQHHQILFGGHARAFAMSTHSTSDRRSLVSSTLSMLADQIDKSIDLIDDNPSLENATARLVIVLSFRIYLFWLVEPDKVFIIAAPPRFEVVPVGEFLATKDFLSLVYNLIKRFGIYPAEGGSRTLYW